MNSEPRIFGYTMARLLKPDKPCDCQEGLIRKWAESIDGRFSGCYQDQNTSGKAVQFLKRFERISSPTPRAASTISSPSTSRPASRDGTCRKLALWRSGPTARLIPTCS